MKIAFYLADAIDTLQSGKLAALGLYTDHVVLINFPHDAPEPTKEVPVAINLVAAFAISGLTAGVHDVEVGVELPNGEQLRRQRESRHRFIVAAGEAVNMLLPLNPLTLPVFGVVNVVLTVDGVENRIPFEVRGRRAEPPPQAVPAN